jgi:spore coat protein CotF
MQFGQTNQNQISGTQQQSQIPEKELMTDVLSSQKFVTDTYNTFANECATPNVRDEFMKILTEEHQIQADVFDTMKKRGWYETPAAQQQKIQQAKQKYQGGSGQA